jgi:hypothetical protein
MRAGEAVVERIAQLLMKDRSREVMACFSPPALVRKRVYSV